MSGDLAGRELVPSAQPFDQPTVRHGITAYVGALRSEVYARVADVRFARDKAADGKPLGRTDVAPLIRDVTGLRDNLTYAATALRQLAKDLDVIVGDEVAATKYGGDKLARGETATLVVADQSGQEIRASIRTPKSRKVAASQLLEALRKVRADGRLAAGATVTDVSAFRIGYAFAQSDMLDVGKWEPQVTKVDGLSRTLQAIGDDDGAGLLDECVREEDGDQVIDVKVEAPKRRRRA